MQVFYVPGMASEAVKARLQRIGQGVLRPEVGLAALSNMMRALQQPLQPALPAVVAVNPFNWSMYLSHLKVCYHGTCLMHNCQVGLNSMSSYAGARICLSCVLHMF